MDLSLELVWQFLQTRQFVDLTHSFNPDIPHFSTDPPETRKVLGADPNTTQNGFTVIEHTLVGQWGTHVDAPAHYSRVGASLDQIPVQHMILPCVVLDFSSGSNKNPDAIFTIEDLRQFEQKHGIITAQSLVLLRTDWSQRWHNQQAFHNIDHLGIQHTPGWSQEVLQMLFEHRQVTSIGHETLDTDPGTLVSQGLFPAETYVLEQNHHQFALLCHLDLLPPTGALAVATFPKPEQGTGFPARVFAILPTPSTDNTLE